MKKLKAPTLATRTDFDDAVNQIALAAVELRDLEAQRDFALQQLREFKQPKIDAVKHRLNALALSAEKYAEAHRAELLPGKAKSKETSLARFGFRTGAPTLKLLSGWTWDKVLACLTGRELWQFIRKPEPEVNKEALHAAHLTGDFTLSDLGMKVAKTETFFVEPKDKAEVRP